MNLPAHHLACLLVHPHRTRHWFVEKLKDGFDVHHLDGNHENNEPSNLALIEHTDHMAVHNGGTHFLGRLKRNRQLRLPKIHLDKQWAPRDIWLERRLVREAKERNRKRRACRPVNRQPKLTGWELIEPSRLKWKSPRVREVLVMK